MSMEDMKLEELAYIVARMERLRAIELFTEEQLELIETVIKNAYINGQTNGLRIAQDIVNTMHLKRTINGPVN